MADADTSLESLRPAFRRLASAFTHICDEDLAPLLGFTFRVTETRRSRERQAALIASGKTRVPIGFHNFGLALDFAIMVNGVYQADDRLGHYAACGDVAHALGMRWGGNWSRFKDYGHVETGEFTLQQFLNGIKGGLVPA